MLAWRFDRVKGSALFPLVLEGANDNIIVEFSDMDVALIATMITAITACAGVYLQRRAVLLSEKGLNRRVDDIEELVARIEKERAERETQINERRKAHESLDVHATLSEIGTRALGNDVFILEGLLVFQQLALIYIYYSRELDDRDPDLANDLGRLCTSVIDYVGSRNHRLTVVRS